jgi:uncharacterized protein (UPF0548 family)
VAAEQLDPKKTADLRAARLTYPEVGRTAGSLPPGYRTFIRTAQLPSAIDFESATHNLLHWQVQQRAGLRVAASSEKVVPEAVALVSAGIGRLSLRFPCRVVYVVNEPRRQGFAYGTLPGHPECGEEAFVLEQHEDGTITFTITAFSRPASALAKLAGPLGRRIQDAFTARYLRALAV